MTDTTTIQRGRAAARRPTPAYIIGLDLETIPSPRAYEAELADDIDWTAAYQAAERGDADAVAELTGMKLGNTKAADKLIARVDDHRAGHVDRLRKSMSLDPTRLAICSAGLYMRAEGASVAVVAHWGIGASECVDYVDPATGCAMTLHRVACHTAPSVPLGELLPAGDGEGLGSDERYVAERRLLLALWDALGQHAEQLACGAAVVAAHNGLGFDLRAIQWRTMLHRDPVTLPGGEVLPAVSATVDLTTRRYASGPVYDTLQHAAGWSSANMSGLKLDAVCRRAGVAGAKLDGMSGAEVLPAAERGEWSRIETYQIGDIVMVHDLATVMIHNGGFHG